MSITHSLSLNNQEVPCTIRKSLRARRISLKIDNDGHLTIVLPQRTAERHGLKFAQQKSEWIINHIDRIQSLKPERPPHYHSGQQLTLFGDPTINLLISPTDKKRPHFHHSHHLDRSILNCYIPYHLSSQTQEITRTLLEKFYRQIARKHLTARANHFVQQLGTTYNSLKLKDQQSRWGSCSRLKNLNFNYRIIIAPHLVIDYLVAHEVSHLKQLNHSPKFWSLVESLMPEYKIHQKWLRKNGVKLVF